MQSLLSVMTIRNRTRPRALVQNQHTRELISAQKTSHKHDNKRPESPTVTLAWHACKCKVHKLHQRYILWHFLTVKGMNRFSLLFLLLRMALCRRHTLQWRHSRRLIRRMIDEAVVPDQSWIVDDSLSVSPKFSRATQKPWAHSEHRFPAPSSKLCQIWLRHWWGTLYEGAAVHRRRQRPPKGLGTDKTVEAA